MKTSRKRVAMFFMVLCLACACWPARAEESSQQEKGTALRGNATFKLRIGGVSRYYTVHVPPGYGGKAEIPVVVMFHGGGGNSRAAQFETGWNLKADQETFLAVFPDALPPDTSRPSSFRHNPQVWNDGSGRFYQGRIQVDDIGFINVLLDDLSRRFKVNTRRVYATGFSNGASMSFRVGVALSKRFAAIAPVSGPCWLENIKLKRMVSLCYITGTTDSLNRISGGGPSLVNRKAVEAEKRAKLPIRESIDKWGAAIGCPKKPQASTQGKGIEIETYAPCRGGAEMIYVAIDGMGHAWPSGKGVLPEFAAGKSASRLKANDFIWDFFKRHEIDGRQH